MSNPVVLAQKMDKIDFFLNNFQNYLKNIKLLNKINPKKGY